ncbi:VOC family protein [Alteromonas ponticola]|uniref:VOC family protein n=1 Tax=Alteromonas aquimaris TaxID=2998417 RepID=A0ABT3P7Z5_9ALTE|nr:VOC family protein [Alteromonas aquimaris]MCW8108893.1 VOC family protein [Alteromonas aquimaris]
MPNNLSVNYLEIPSQNIPLTKTFFKNVFNWSFTDYGEDYVAFSTPEIEGGFYASSEASRVNKGAALIVFYSDNLAQTQSLIENANGIIVKPIFSFPGGRRFHFIEPGGSEFAVWSDK